MEASCPPLDLRQKVPQFQGLIAICVTIEPVLLLNSKKSLKESNGILYVEF
jgi:hypothetical protein